MSWWRDLRDVAEMYTTWGMVIMTGMDGAMRETAVSPPPSAYTGKTYTHTGIRTTIQLSSDYVTTLSTAVLQHPHLWQEHMTYVDTKLSVLDKLRRLAQQSWLLFMLIPLIWFGYDLTRIRSLADAWVLIYPMLLSIVIVLTRKWILRFLQVTILPLLMRITAWFVQWKFKQFVGER